MRTITRFRPTPAMVVATIALLVALAGTSAAAVALVPRNSVGSDQVIDGSLKRKDFKAGQVLGVEDVVSRSIDGPVTATLPEDFSPVASLAIEKPGAYLIWSTARVEGDKVGSRDHGGECRLIAGADLQSVPDNDQSDSKTSPATLWNIVVHGFASPGTVELQCAGYLKGPSQVRDIKLAAIRIAGP
jgi:hypothetical protein